MEPIFVAHIVDLAAASPTEVAGRHARGELDALLDQGLLGEIARQVDRLDPRDQESDVGLAAIVNLLSVDAVARRFVREVGVARVVGWLRSGDESQTRTGVHVVSWLVWHRNRAVRMQLVEAGIVPLLVARLHVDLEAVDALARLAATPENMSALVAAGAFDALGQHLPRWVTDATCLHALGPSLRSAEARRGLVAAGWPTVLRGLLRHDGACRLLARLLPSMSASAQLRALYDLADWHTALGSSQTGVREEALRLCLPALGAELREELLFPGGDPDRDPVRLVNAYRRYAAMADFRRLHATALSRVRLARHFAVVDGRYKGLLDAWVRGDAARADAMIEQLTTTVRGLALTRDDFEQQSHLRTALTDTLRRVDADGAAATWASTYTLAACLSTRRPVEDALWGKGTVEVFLRPWALTTRDASAVGGVANPPKGDVRVGDVWIAPDAGIVAPEVLAVLVASLSVLARRWQRLPALGVSHLALTRAGRSPHAELARPAAQLARLPAWRDDGP